MRIIRVFMRAIEQIASRHAQLLMSIYAQVLIGLCADVVRALAIYAISLSPICVLTDFQSSFRSETQNEIQNRFDPKLRNLPRQHRA